MEMFSALLALCVGNSPVKGKFPSRRPVTRSLNIFLDFRMNKRLNKPLRHRLFETPSGSLWCHCNVTLMARGEWPDSSVFETLVKNIAIELLKIHPAPLKLSWDLPPLTSWGRDMADILQTTFSNTFSWMKMHEFWISLSNSSRRVTIFSESIDFYLGSINDGEVLNVDVLLGQYCSNKNIWKR